MLEPLIEPFCKQLNVFSANLELFNGTSNYNAIDFISDLNSYCEYLGKDEDSEKLSVLTSHLIGEGKIVFRLVKNPNYESVISALKLHITPKEQALHRIKAELFGTKQTSGETFKHFHAGESLRFLASDWLRNGSWVRGSVPGGSATVPLPLAI